ncbi:caspase family protein [Candidatus Marithrix sp. Canyon 246]|nr:caspase family protein [Candidatus Marithrix sp. Canyon 246]
MAVSRKYLFLLLLFLFDTVYANCALLIGNSQYENGRLTQPVNDATDLAKALKKLGFQVILKTNLSNPQINQASIEFTACLKKSGGVGLFYFSGHGTQVKSYWKRENYLIPINNNNILDQVDVKRNAFYVSKLLARLKRVRNEGNIIILDASRKKPYPGGRGGLTSIRNTGYSLIAYSAYKNKTIRKTSNYKRNSLYVKLLLKELKTTKRKRIKTIFDNVNKAVRAYGYQWPYRQISLRKPLYLPLKKIKARITETTDKHELPKIAKIQIDKTHITKLSSVAFSPNGRYLLSGGKDRKLWLWNLKSGRLVRTFVGHSDIISSVAFSSDSRYAISGSRDRTVRIWNVNNGRLLDTYRGHNGFVSSVNFSSDGRYVLSGSYDKTLQFWDRRNARLIRRFKRGNWVLSMDISRRFALSGHRDRTMRLWNLDTGRLRRSYRTSSYFMSVAFFPNANRIVSGHTDNTLRVWNMNGRMLRRFWGHSGSVFSVDVSSDGRKIVSGSRDNTVKLWNASNGRLIHTFKHENDVYSVKFTSNSNRIISAGNDGIFLWDLKTKKNIARLVVFKDQQWLTVVPETGAFVASRRGGDKLSIWLRGRGYKLNNNKGYNRADLVKTKLSEK